jgi:hypothetical protein
MRRVTSGVGGEVTALDDLVARRGVEGEGILRVYWFQKPKPGLGMRSYDEDPYQRSRGCCNLDVVTKKVQKTMGLTW